MYVGAKALSPLIVHPLTLYMAVCMIDDWLSFDSYCRLPNQSYHHDGKLKVSSTFQIYSVCNLESISSCPQPHIVELDGSSTPRSGHNRRDRDEDGTRDRSLFDLYFKHWDRIGIKGGSHRKEDREATHGDTIW